MERQTVVLGLGLLGGVLFSGADAIACGDKLIVMGRGLHPTVGRTGPPASILVFADPRGSMPAALDKGHLRKDLEKAGHRLRSVGTREEVTAALRTGTYDLLFADFKTASSLEAEASEAASKPTVLPTLFNPTDAELAAASKDSQCLRVPGQSKDYLAVVSNALALRKKQAPAGRKN